MMRNVQKAFTLIELLVVISLIAILAAIIFPVFSRARDKSNQSVCISNLKQIGIAFRMYQQDNDNQRPHQIDRLVPAYISAPALLICPSDATKNYANLLGITTVSPYLHPISYLELTDQPKKFWDFIVERQSKAGYVFDVLHGEKHRIQRPDSAPYYHGLTLRLNMDGSVVSRYIVYPNDAWFDAWVLANYNPGEPLPENILLK